MRMPPDVRDWVRSVFRSCNERTAVALSTMPTTHEAALDQAFVTRAADFAGPVQFPSQWVVTIGTHFLGGGRHFGAWEIADIGVLLQFRRGGKLVKSKVLLLQSKRLYPTEEVFDEDSHFEYRLGFSRLFREDTAFRAVTAPRTFSFQDASKYEALKVGDGQYVAIKDYETQYNIPVYYLLYHPVRIPSTTVLPRAAGAPPRTDEDDFVGARVIPAGQVRSVLANRQGGYQPAWADFQTQVGSPAAKTSRTPGWLVEEFIADLGVDCKVGHIASSASDPGLFRIFNQRTGPISSAIAVAFDAPPGTALEGDDGP